MKKFSVGDDLYMYTPFGVYTGVVKEVTSETVIIESTSPTGKGCMLAEYEIKNIEWQHLKKKLKN